MLFVKYSNKRTGKTTSWNTKNAKKPEAQFIKDNQHLGYTEDELKEAHGLIVSTVGVQEDKKVLETKQSGSKNPGTDLNEKKS